MAPPGRRFRNRYRSHRRSRSSKSLWRRLQRILLAVVALAIGVVLVFIPGPAILFFFMAGALLASDWLWMARTLDWLEVRLRAGWRRAQRWWKRLPWAGRIALLVAGGSLSAAAHARDLPPDAVKGRLALLGSSAVGPRDTKRHRLLDCRAATLKV